MSFGPTRWHPSPRAVRMACCVAWLSALTAARSGAQAGGAAAATPCTGPDTTAAACHRPYGGDLTRATIGFEQIGSSGLSSDQRFSFDFFISRLIPALAADNGPERHYLGGPLRWWGDVRLASYPQAVTDGASAFVSVDLLKVWQRLAAPPSSAPKTGG